MKKMYINPKTDHVVAQLVQALCVSVDPNPTDNMESEAPQRGGDFMPL